MTRLGFLSLSLLVVANMIGAGVFTTSGFTLQDLGTPGRVVWAWLIGGIAAMCGAISYAAAARRLTESGGEYLFLSRWIHPAAGCAAGWVSLFAGFSGATAAAALATSEYLPAAWLGSSAWIKPSIATLLIVGFGTLHASSRKHGLWTQNLAVLIKLFFIGLIAYAAFRGGHLQQWPGRETIAESPSPAWRVWATCLMWISFCYSGFNAAVYVAGEADDAKRTVPRAIIAATLLVTLIYLALNAIFVFGSPAELIREQPDVAARCVRFLAGETWESILRATVVICLVTSVSSMMLAGPRVYARMALDGVFPRWLRPATTEIEAPVSDTERDATKPVESKSPVAATILQIAVATSMVWFSTLRDLLGYLGMTLALSTAGTVAAAAWKRDSLSSRPGWFVQSVAAAFIAFTLMTAALAGLRDPWQGLAVIITLSAGGAFWFIRSLRRDAAR